MQIAQQCVVSIHYTLSNEEGVELDSSAGGEPLVYLHGAGNIIPGLENALAGHSAGDQIEVTVGPAEGYGEHDPALVQTVPREAFQGVEEVLPGMRFQASDEHGNVQRIVVVAVSDEGVSVDANHPLAGQTLCFAVTVESVRAATPEEIEHGHPH